MPVPAKTPSECSIETRYFVMPEHTNAHGTAFGGVILSWIDLVASMVGQKHCQGVVVTASIDQVSFTAPIHVGDHVILKGCVNYVGKTSMEIGILVLKENPVSGEVVRAMIAYLTFVHVDENGKPKEVPPLKPETADEKRRFKEAALRSETRKNLWKKIREERAAEKNGGKK